MFEDIEKIKDFGRRVLNNKKLYYGNFIESHESTLLILVGWLIRKDRFINSLKFSSSSLIPPFFKKSKPITITESELSLKELELLNKFKQDGYVQLPELHTELANELLVNYDRFFKNPHQDRESGYQVKICQVLPQCLLDFILDKRVNKLLSLYSNCKMYLSSPPQIVMTYPLEEGDSSRERVKKKRKQLFSDLWHHDGVYLLQAHILLNDITANETHMAYAKRSNRFRAHHITTCASDEYVEKFFETKKFVGKKGTVFLFDGSRGLHKLMAKKDSLRKTLVLRFTRGNHLDAGHFQFKNLKFLDLDRFGPEQLEIIEFFRG